MTLTRRCGLQLALFAAAASLTACGGTPTLETPASAESWLPINLAVSEITIESAAVLPSATDFITRRRSTELSGAARNYLQDRYQATGGNVLARALIEQAQVIEMPVPTTEGVAAVFKSEPDAELQLSLAVRLSVIDVLGVEGGFAQAQVSRSRQLDKRLGIIERDAIAKQLMADIIRQLDDSLVRAVDLHLGEYRRF